jgi:hypothetical protein
MDSYAAAGMPLLDSPLLAEHLHMFVSSLGARSTQYYFFINNRFLWISMDFYGFLWNSMDFYGFLWISVDSY